MIGKPCISKSSYSHNLLDCGCHHSGSALDLCLFFFLSLTSLEIILRQHSKAMSVRIKSGIGERRERMLFAFSWLHNVPLASLSAECQDSVCKQSGHVHGLTWRKLLSSCPGRVTPEVNPDIDTRSQDQR